MRAGKKQRQTAIGKFIVGVRDHGVG